MIIGMLLVVSALIKGDIHSNKEYAANAILGVVAGFAPFLLDAIADVTEVFKMLASIAAFGVASISLFRAWKFKEKK